MKNKQLEASLSENFPFMKRTTTAESISYQQWGCECGDGWYQLICDLCAEISKAYSQADSKPDIIVLQVKQKFARLRFYYTFEGVPAGVIIDFLGSGTLRTDPDDDDAPDDVKALHAKIKSIVRRYEEKSGTVCELCGAAGALRKLENGWLKTLCGDCFETLVSQQKKRRC